jgi:putative Holliday junction resolvase
MGKPRIASIDYGRKRIGLALSDESQTIAFNLPTFKVTGKMEQTTGQLAGILQAHELEAVIVGNPLKLTGQACVMADEVKDFVQLLQAVLPCPIKLWDERLTSLQADRTLKEANLTRKKRAGLVDGVAAVILLQSYLDWKQEK